MILRRAPLLCLLAALGIFGQSPGTKKDSPRERDPLRIDVVASSEDLHESLQDKSPLHFGSSREAGPTIEVDDSVQYQQMDGFGASLTDSSAWLISQKLTAQQRRELLQMLFDPKKGIGLSMLRQPMGASDFALKDYSYDDLPPGQTDPDMKHFSINHDREQIIPILREALALNSNLKVIGSPWSPPGWMKTSGSMIKGTLLPSAYAPFAKYFVSYVRAYEASGIPIFAVTPENEPLNIPDDYPGMGMSSEEQTKFIRDNLGPAFRAAGIKAKILTFDHNWDLINFPIKVLSDKQAAAFIPGIAIHCYGGSSTAQTELHNRFPDKDIWLTECSGGEWQKGRLLEEQVRLVISTTRNWAKGVILWNLALNQNHEPFLGGCRTCRAVVTIDDSAAPSRIIPTVDFTALGHASKFVAPGAFRIDSSTFEQDRLESVAFRNPDGSIAAIVLNGGTTAATFNLSWKGKYASYHLEPAAVATFRWSSQAAAH
ncbi:MAG TPA: glycoside hydrolase family 30 beta sandwich domain-containing protein [Candidatus Acidoferrum sp.]|nr:glycoside hydrolase family 30 beta sandwich domain-containing protein [Candidatus Acidoferrum sp.]